MDNDNTAWVGFEGEEQETNVVLEDVPLDNEDGVATIFPTSQHDTGGLMDVRQRVQASAVKTANEERKREAQAKLRRQRYTAIIDRVIQWIEYRRLLPQSWLARSIESGDRWPVFVCVIRNNYKTWLNTLIATVSFVASLLWLLQWVLGAPSVVLHDGTTVQNLYAPSTVYTVDLTSTSVSNWLERHRKGGHVVRAADLKTGYFSANVYHVSEDRNITLDWIFKALHQACNHDALDFNDRCTCMPAIEIGVLANVIFIDGVTMLNPRITLADTEQYQFEYGDGINAPQPISATIEYMDRSGLLERFRKESIQVACIVRSLALADPPQKNAPGGKK
jgi:hypothetical protein